MIPDIAGKEKHSHIGASSAYRWMPCPGSVELCKKAPPQEESDYAREGTAAHEIAALCLKMDTNPDKYLGTVASNGIDITDEIVESVKEYVDTVRMDMRPNYKLDVEVMFDLGWLHPGLFGTADAVMYEPYGLLRIYDYKHGAGVPVDVTDNKQLLYYALGAIGVITKASGVSIHDFKDIELVIVQPRCRHKDGPIRRWVTSPEYLHKFADDLRRAAIKTEEKEAPLVTGNHCRWCAAKPICPQIVSDVQDAARVDFGLAETQLDLHTKGKAAKPSLPVPSDLTKEQLIRVLKLSDLISAWLSSCEAYAQSLLEAGQGVEGFKLVRGRANRKWKDEQQVVEALRDFYADDELFKKSLLSPAQMEKLVGKKHKDLIAGLWETPEGALTIAPEYDKRPALPPPAKEDFKD